MSKNASSDFDKDRKPDNPQETLNEENFYYAGFLAAEMSCSLIKATNHNPVGTHFYLIDFTVSNADKRLLRKVNKVVMGGQGVISPIKGAFNLSARGKRKVRNVLTFLAKYPIVTGDLAKDRISLLKQALEYLETNRGHSKHKEKTRVMDTIRSKLRSIKTTGVASRTYHQERVSCDALGYFLAGVLDGDGSFGFKKSGSRKQPFFLVAMRDRKIPELFKRFLEAGNVRFRKDGVYHYECNDSQSLQKISAMFLDVYPLQHEKQRRRMQKLQRILNDYTRSSERR